LSLEISDNGRGLNTDDLAKARSFGIRGLHERAGMVGGWVELSSGSGGTTLMLSVPLTSLEPAVPAGLPTAPIHDADDPSQWGAL
jgi:glucose-6-phosphate-specific signal transduction histidine kinase